MSSTTELNTLKVNVLTEAQYAAAVQAGEIEENELYYTTDLTTPDTIIYSTTVPTSANTEGLKIVLLDEEPATKYSGWLYLIKEA